MFEALLEAALGGKQTILWRGKPAVVLHRSADRVYLLIDDGPRKKVNELQGGEVIVANRLGEQQAAEVQGKPAAFYQKSVEDPPPSPTAYLPAGRYRDYVMRRRLKGNADVRVKWLDTWEVKPISLSLQGEVSLLTIITAKAFDQEMSKPSEPVPTPVLAQPTSEPTTPAELPSKLSWAEPKPSKSKKPERPRKRKYFFDPARGEYVLAAQEDKEVEPNDLLENPEHQEFQTQVEIAIHSIGEGLEP